MDISSFLQSSSYHFSQSQIATQIGHLLFQSVTLPFNMQAQTQTNWCWAATSTSVSHFYFSGSTWTQCLVANGELSRGDCCQAPVPGPCNVPWYLDRALQRTHNFQSMVSGPLGYDAILAELQAGRVIGARIGWSGGGGHFMVIHGCSRVGGTPYVDIDDPIYGKSHITLATFTNNYQGSGTWTHSYYTRRWPSVHVNFAVLSAAALDLIRQHRPLLQVKRGEAALSAAPSSQAALSAPHHVYVVGLEDLAERSNPVPDKAVALRVLETENGRNRALFDLDPSGTALHGMSDSHETLEILSAALAEIGRIAEREDGEAELRFVRVPALYVEAFWLHRGDLDRDIVVPVRAPGLLTPLHPLPASEFVRALREPARDRLRSSRDDTIAP